MGRKYWFSLEAAPPTTVSPWPWATARMPKFTGRET